MNLYKNFRYHHKDINHSFVDDYNEAVQEYKKSFSSKDKVLKYTPDPAVRKCLYIWMN